MHDVIRFAVGLGMVLLLATPAGARQLAVMPVDGPGVFPALRSSVEAQLRAALSADGHTLQAAAETQQHIEGIVASGVACNLLEIDCASRVAVVSGVDGVVSSTLLPVRDQLVLSLSFVDVSGDVKATRAASRVSLDDPSLAAQVVRRALGAQGTPAAALPLVVTVVPSTASLQIDGVDQAPGLVWLSPGTHALEARVPGQPLSKASVVLREEEPAPVEVTLRVDSGGAAWAVPVAWGGLAAVAVGGASAAILEVVLNSPLERDGRLALRGLGFAALGVAAVGVVTAGVGTGAALFGGGGDVEAAPTPAPAPPATAAQARAGQGS